MLRYAPGMDMLALMRPYFTDLRGQHIIAGAGHWVQQEQPGAVNAELLSFLQGL